MYINLRIDGEPYTYDLHYGYTSKIILMLRGFSVSEIQ